MRRAALSAVFLLSVSVSSAQSPDVLVGWAVGNAKVIEARKSIEAEPGRFSKELGGASLTTAFKNAEAKTVVQDTNGNISILRDGADHSRAIILVARDSDASLAYSVYRLLNSQRIETKSDVVFILEGKQHGSAATVVAALPHERKTVVAFDDIPLGSLGHRDSGLRTLRLKKENPQDCQRVRIAAAAALKENSNAKVLPGSGCSLDIETTLGANDLLSSTDEALDAVDAAVKETGIEIETTADRAPRRVSVGSDALQVGTGVLNGLGIQPQYVSVHETGALLRANNLFVALGVDNTTPENSGRSVVIALQTVISLAGIR